MREQQHLQRVAAPRPRQLAGRPVLRQAGCGPNAGSHRPVARTARPTAADRTAAARPAGAGRTPAAGWTSRPRYPTAATSRPNPNGSRGQPAAYGRLSHVADPTSPSRAGTARRRLRVRPSRARPNRTASSEPHSSSEPARLSERTARPTRTGARDRRGAPRHRAGPLVGPLALPAAAEGTASPFVVKAKLAADGALNVKQTITFAGTAPPRSPRSSRPARTWSVDRQYVMNLTDVTARCRRARRSRPTQTDDGRFTTVTVAPTGRTGSSWPTR